MTFIDLILIFVLLVAAWNGYQKGFVMQVIHFVGVFVAYWAAKTYGPDVKPWLESLMQNHAVPSITDHFSLSKWGDAVTSTILQNGYGVIAFVLVFAIGILLIEMVGKVLSILLSLPGLSLLNRIAGLFVGAMMGVLVLIILVNVLVFVPNTMVHSAIADSQIATAVLKADISHLLFFK